MTMLNLPEPPPGTGANCLTFYAELRRMLNQLRPTKLSDPGCSVEFSNGTLEVWLVHSERDTWSVGATMSESDGIIFAGSVHEHFSPGEMADTVRPWTFQMVDFIAEALCGDIETRTVFRGSSPISVEHFRIETDGSSTSLGSTGYLNPARAMLWLPKTSKTERISFN